MKSVTCPRCGAISWGWGDYCGACGLDEQGAPIPGEMGKAVTEAVANAAQESAALWAEAKDKN